ncbi:3'(2'),5'-bisphosphate nucleotidase CysQ [Roseateles sp. SL47]|uniref:3'(2'),5'-bisphosphate nucleotidase CysQ n=1 Tax=Roseateles sp. SL47 TaxID=2995138 RepID=UPI00226D6AAD|nr:3'(2'),5'-bisphosphate nucleotidase CysQ [Roseateles sp. SL47]WAC71646.1 3'(2'),5'-bisphosphate nucleotidase CysQ [Roseateles sp. SL47]
MGQINEDQWIERLLAIVRMAGEAVLSIYRAGPGVVSHKADQSPLTEADLASHRILSTELAGLLPDCAVVSEECDASQSHRCGSGRFWLIDPLDGTKEFIARSGEFTVNVALIENGRSVFGVVDAPAMDTIYWGGAGFGAWRRVGAETSCIRVAVDPAVSVCRVVASKSHLNDDTRAFIDRLGAVSLVQAGSSLKICRVAEGMADVYPRLSPTCEWDVAAAQAVLEGAGGAVLDLQGAPLRHGKADVLNPSFVAVRDAALMPR